MFTTFDRYLLGRLIHTFVVLFVSAYGLFIVIDLFSNIDDFQHGSTNHAELFQQIVVYYAYRAFQFFEMAGPMLIVVSVITVLGLLRKNSETFPLLAAGVPAFRLLRPLLLAGVILNVGLIVNQEFIIPSIAVPLQTPRGSNVAQVQKVEAVYDHSNYLMHIDGDQVNVEEQTLVNPSFLLPEQFVKQFCAIKAEKARYQNATDRLPSGWMLINLTGVFDEKHLTDEGRERLLSQPNGKDLFIVSDVSFDQLYNRGRNVQFLSSLQLIQRIQNPSTGPVPVRRQSMALHCRITRPILCLINICIALPLVCRRESHSLIANMAICAAILGIFYGIAEGSFALGGSGLIKTDLAAWFPVMITGAAGAWTAGLVQT